MTCEIGKAWLNSRSSSCWEGSGRGKQSKGEDTNVETQRSSVSFPGCTLWNFWRNLALVMVLCPLWHGRGRRLVFMVSLGQCQWAHSPRVLSSSLWHSEDNSEFLFFFFLGNVLGVYRGLSTGNLDLDPRGYWVTELRLEELAKSVVMKTSVSINKECQMRQATYQIMEPRQTLQFMGQMEWSVLLGGCYGIHIPSLILECTKSWREG